MKKTTLYALLLVCLQQNTMMFPSFFTEIPEPTKEQPTRNTAEEGRKQRAQEAAKKQALEEQRAQQSRKQTPAKNDRETQQAENKSDETTTQHEVKVTSSWRDRLPDWNTIKRGFFSFVHEKSYVKEVITQALNGDPNATAEIEKFKNDRSWDGTLSIKKLSFQDKKDVVATLQDEANKVYEQKIAALKQEKLMASGNDAERARIDQLIADEKQAFQDTVKKLVKTLDPMLLKSTDSQNDRRGKNLEKILTTFDPQTNAVRLRLYREHTTLNSALFKYIKEDPALRTENPDAYKYAPKEKLTPAELALAQRFNVDIGEKNYDNTLIDNINQKYESLNPQQQKVFIESLNRLATSTFSTQDILEAAYNDAKKVSTSWFSRSTTSDSSTASNTKIFKPESDTKLNPNKALQYIRDVEKRFTQGRMDSMEALTQIESAYRDTNFTSLRDSKLLPNILKAIQDKENEQYQTTMLTFDRKLRQTTDDAEIQLILLQKQEARIAFKARCQKIQDAFTEIYRQSINTQNFDEITLTFNEENGNAQFTVNPFKSNAPTLLKKPKNFPENLNEQVTDQLLKNEELLNAFMTKYDMMTSPDSKQAFIDMLNYNAKSTNPHPLTTTLINTTWYMTTMPKELLQNLDPHFKYLLMTNLPIVQKLMDKYETK